MRIDKYLKVSRLIKRRTLASEFCTNGRIKINDNIAKPSSKVKIGDVITINYGSKDIKVRVLFIDEKVKKEDSSSMYECV